jgi:hypothetical protein
MNRNHKSIRTLLLLPLAFSLLYFVASIFHFLNDDIGGVLETFPFPLLTIAITIILIVNESKRFFPIRVSNKFAYAIPGFMAPTALFGAWTLAPSHIGGVAWGGIHYFLDAVTRYPDVGPLNSMVFLGMVVVFCASCLPVLIAWGYLSSWSRYWMLILGFLLIAAYLIVSLKLDLNLWLAGLYGADHASLVFLLHGPLSRTLAVISSCYLLMRLISASSSLGQ